MSTSTSTPEMPIVEVKPDAKTAAMAAPDKIKVEGFTFYPFSRMRLAAMEMTGNELLNSHEHCLEYLKKNKRSVKEIDDETKSFEIMSHAIPSFMFQLVSLAFICVTPKEELAFLTLDKKDFRKGVFNFWDDLTKEQEQLITARAFQELAESQSVRDYVVKSKPGEKKPTKN